MAKRSFPGMALGGAAMAKVRVVFSDVYVPHHAWRDRRLDRQRKRKVFFSEEKKQKTFDLWRGGSPDYVRQSAKVFWFFFSKKNGFLWCR
jgi:hypothetical protein